MSDAADDNDQHRRVLRVDVNPWHTLWYACAVRGRRIEPTPLHFYSLVGMPMPHGLDALVIAGDLQGREFPVDGSTVPPRLLADVLADELQRLAETGDLPDGHSTGVLLAGDLYARPGKRGGVGDVTHLLERFADDFAWIVAVGGNHDAVDGWTHDRLATQSDRFIHFLDGGCVELGGTVIAGVSGVVGSPRPGRPFVRTRETQRERLEAAIAARPQILVLHQGPVRGASPSKGSEDVDRLLRQARIPLCVFGHESWANWFIANRDGTALLNVDHRVVVCRREAKSV